MEARKVSRVIKLSGILIIAVLISATYLIMKNQENKRVEAMAAQKEAAYYIRFLKHYIEIGKSKKMVTDYIQNVAQDQAKAEEFYELQRETSMYLDRIQFDALKEMAKDGQKLNPPQNVKKINDTYSKAMSELIYFCELTPEGLRSDDEETLKTSLEHFTNFIRDNVKALGEISGSAVKLHKNGHVTEKQRKLLLKLFEEAGESS